jgi:integrase
VADLFEHYLQVHAKRVKRTWERDEREYNRLVKPEIGTLSLADVSRDVVEKLIASIEEDSGRGPARKARALLSKMFEVGIAGGWCEHNPVRGTRRPDFDPRQRYLKADEVVAFLGALEQLESDLARDFFKLALFTGARRSNVASMEWSELDLSQGLWTIPASKAKGKRAQVVPLSSHALEIIERRRQKRRQGVPWVLPGRGKRGHYSDPKDAWKRVCELSGIEDLRIHDLRRSLGAWQQRQGASLRTIQQTLGHSDPSITARVYSPMEHEQVRAASQAALDALMGVGR